MKIEPDRHYAVVTGDVIESSHIDPELRARLPGILRRCADEVRQALPEAVPVDAAIYRGDAWQLLVVNPEQALLATLHLRTGLQSALEETRLDTRAAIAVAPIDFIGAEGVGTGDGPAFRLSGQVLEKLDKRVSLGLAAPDLFSEDCLQALLVLVDHIASRWSGRQARAVRGALLGWTQEEIANRAWDDPVSQQTVAQHLDRAGWRAVQRALSFFASRVAIEVRKYP